MKFFAGVLAALTGSAVAVSPFGHLPAYRPEQAPRRSVSLLQRNKIQQEVKMEELAAEMPSDLTASMTAHAKEIEGLCEKGRIYAMEAINAESQKVAKAVREGGSGSFDAEKFEKVVQNIVTKGKKKCSDSAASSVQVFGAATAASVLAALFF